MQPLDDRRKRLIYRSWHRGTREMDLLLGSFADRHVPGFSEEELGQYESLLQIADPDLYGWIAGRDRPPANLSGSVMGRLLDHRFAKP
jgi:antitoxin CptB